ncbi:MAG TPA: mechanosensitive ion channel family protein [Blastocatellia bacterium]|nr:mechanosensitive ion channel family protein [Blastocatellia bacterium]
MPVRLDGRTLFRVGPVADADANSRARRIEGRLANLLQNPQLIAPARIEASGSGGSERIISIAGVPVVTVTTEDAQDNLTTTEALSTQWAQALDSALERSSARRLSAWGRFRAEVQASVETAFARLAESAITIIPRALAALLVIGLFWAVAAGIRWLMRLIFRRIVEDLTVENLIKQVAYYAVWGLGIIVAADALGFDPQTVVTGLGLTGLALGFALKDIISNFVSGILILTLRPFELGDQIVVGPTEGDVERIELRATQIRTYDGRVVLVPNADVFTSRVTNNTASPVRRGSVELFLSYNNDLRKAIAVVQEAAQTTEGVLDQPATSVRVRELGPGDMKIEARFWTDSRRSDFLATTSAVRQSIVSAVKESGTVLPDPGARTLSPHDIEKWRTALGVASLDREAGEDGYRADETPQVSR